MAFDTRPKKAAKRSGRPRKTSELPHAPRPHHVERFPLLVTVRLVPGAYNLRSRRSFKEVERAFFNAMAHADCRICEFSVMGNHIHMLIETRSKRSLSSAMRSMGISLARRMNKMMGRSGRVIADRYHASELRTPQAVRRARNYVLSNHKKHFGATYSVDPYSSRAFDRYPEPESNLLHMGWQRGSPLGSHEQQA
jgi:REP element-mobilizing transposase RayT